MLCSACEDIFRQTYMLGSSKKIAWMQDLDSFHRAQSLGCQICNFLRAQLQTYPTTANITAAHFPCYYSFELHNADWARWGQEPEYLEVQVGGKETEDFAEERAGKAAAQFGADYSVHKLRYILKKECHKLHRGEIEMWAVLTFEITGISIRFPLQVHKGGTVEELAQLRLADQHTTGSDETLQLGKHWLSQCISNHPECKSVYEDLSWHPHRLIHVGTPDDPCLRLVLGSQLSSDIRYATLSHCWGNVKHSVVTKETITGFFDFIPPEILSQTAQDAVHVVRALGLQHLWIDGLCIVQDDIEDWHAQSTQMSKVYGFSSCTIAAAASRSGEDSFLCSRNQYTIRPCTVPSPFGQGSDIDFQISTRSLGSIFDEEVKSTMWHNRGWVFQERLLSQRLLIFGSTQMMWSCQRISAAESWPGGRTSKHHIDRFESFEAEKLELHELLNSERQLEVADVHWESLVRRYTSAEMTKAADRLVALQGIASRVIGATGRSYLFGLWIDNTLPQSLLWHLSTTMIGSARLIDNVPSWSWGSVVGPVDFLNDQAPLAQIYVHLPESQASCKGSSKLTEWLEIHGPLFEMTLALHTSKRYFKLRRDERFELHRRMSIHPALLLPLHHGDQSSEKKSVRVKMELKKWTTRARIFTSEFFHRQGRLLRKFWLDRIYAHILTGLAATQAWQDQVYKWFARPLVSSFQCVSAVFFGLLMVLPAIVFVVCTFMWENKYLHKPLYCFVKTGRLCWVLLKMLAKYVWFPFRWIGYKIHGDPAWDWILLWNITVPFPYFFPGIFGPLVSRPRTAYEWEEFRMNDFEQSSSIPEGPPYDQWMARVFPDSSTPFIDADCWLDVPLDEEADFQVTCLLVLRRYQIHGLLLKRLEGQKNRYRRIGLFKSFKYESCFAWTEEAMQSIVLG